MIYIKLAGGTDNTGGSYPLFTEEAKAGYPAWADRLLPILQGRWDGCGILITNPFGYHKLPAVDGGYRNMWIQQYDLARAAGLSYAKSMAGLATFCDLMERYVGVPEVCMYIGTHATCKDPLREGREAVKPYLNEIGPIVSLGFDADSELTAATTPQRIRERAFDHCRELQESGVNVYFESRIHQNYPEVYDIIRGTIALRHTDMGPQEPRAANAKKLFEVKPAITITSSAPQLAQDAPAIVNAWEPEFIPAIRDFVKWKASDYAAYSRVAAEPVMAAVQDDADWKPPLGQFEREEAASDVN